MATEMGKTADCIVGSFDARTAALADLVDGVHATLTGMTTDRKRMSREQIVTLTGFADSLARTVSRMLHAFQTNHNAMARELRMDLKAVRPDIESDVASLLKDYNQAHARMSKKLRSDLNEYANDIARGTRKLLGGFHREQGVRTADVKLAHEAWRDIAGTMAARRNGARPATTPFPA
jgi:DNA integrity scanning protein DisA with diadenylate cyclase activity